MQKTARRTALAVVAAIVFTSGGWLLAQQTQTQYGTPAVPADIRTGDDLGFRVHGMKDGRALGTFVIRTKNGQWVEVIPAPTRGFVVPLESK
jgi:hypothetical protein